MEQPRRKWAFRPLGLVPFILVLIVSLPLGCSLFHIARTMKSDRDELRPLPRGVVDDVSRLNETKVSEVIDISPDIEIAVKQIREVLGKAKSQGLKVSISGARHSMGGQTIYPDGFQINMLPLNGMTIDEEKQILRVQSGARWAEILPYLDRRGYSVSVMQSNNSFSVGGSISVNCHGWQPGRPPIASTVLGIRLLTADGKVLRCTRNKNQELFALALGGYGLFGVILDVDLRVVRNDLYKMEQVVIPVADYVATYKQKVVKAQDIGMAYGRLCVVPDERFLREAVLAVFKRTTSKDNKIPPLEDPGLLSLKRAIFRGSEGSDYGKKFRWQAETKLQQHAIGKFFSRNQLQNEGVEVLQNRSADRTDILHEYFVPPKQFIPFLDRLREIIPKHQADLLNITIREVRKDEDTYLRYARSDVFAFVILFSQPRTPEGDASMERMTREIIDAVLDLGGCYYLPYRLHATKEQFNRSFPNAGVFLSSNGSMIQMRCCRTSSTSGMGNNDLAGFEH